MSLSSLALFSSWRDYSGDWNSYVEPQCAPIEASTCHAPRYAVIPDVSHQTIPSNGKVEYNFHLPAGSLIVGWFVPNQTYAIQLTDVQLGHQFFQDPITIGLLFTNGGFHGRMPAETILPTPHPVVGDGLFTFEAWGTPGDTVILILLVAEVTDCPVK